ncbi:type II secretion system protein GspM [Zobellella maritima]|uniref:type II secretion system protein GspM n=1 Tax=Zobellella maritima TaxID=2059725 RepID=UPI000E305CDB|nr:type II secretion system protein GspM [Zobellella maritima]
MRLGARQQQLAAVAILVCALLLVFILLIHPLFSLFIQQGATLDRLENQLSHYRHLSDDLEQTELTLQRLQRENPSAELYLPETRPSLSSAWLQQHLNQLVSHSGGQLVSIQNVELKTMTPLPGIAIRVHLRGEIGQLVPLFHALESGRPMLFINDLVISASHRRRNIRVIRNLPINRRRDPSYQNIPSLDIRFNLLGYSQKRVP